MIRSAVTVSLVPEATGGPFVFWNGLADAFQNAASMGYDAVEIFASGPDAVDRRELKALIEQTGLPVAAVGTGAGMVKHGLALTDHDQQKRTDAIDFVKQMIDFGAEFEAPAIIGSMQGRWGGEINKQAALELLAIALNELGQYAAAKDLPLIYEPLNRYETNLLNTIGDTVTFLDSLKTPNVVILADLFHMNIEEANVAEAIRSGGQRIGHIHFVDSNRRAAGFGHTDFRPIVEAIKSIGFEGILAVEAFPIPTPESAAQQSIDAFRAWFAPKSANLETTPPSNR